MTEPVERRVDLPDLVPDVWRNNGGCLWVASFRMVGIALNDIRGRRYVDLDGVWAVLFWGSLPCLSTMAAIEPRVDGQIQINVGQTGEPWPTAPTTLLMTLLPGTRTNGAMRHAEERCQEAVALLSAVAGHLVVYEHLENYIFNLDNQALEPTAVLIYNALWASEVDLSDGSRDTWTIAAKSLSKHPHRNRIALSLRWFDDAKRSRGVDAFLKFWFALETLAMPNTTNIRPLEEAVATIYSLDRKEAHDRFGIGRIFGLRSRVVHDGLIVDVSPQLLELLHGLYLDLFVHYLGHIPPMRAGAVIDTEGPVDALIPAS